MSSQEYTPSYGSQMLLEMSASIDFDKSSPTMSCVTYRSEHCSSNGQPRNIQFCTTGCSVLDHKMNGGIPVGGIIEVWGDAASAKTQFCLQLALTAQLTKAKGGLESDVLFIYTKGELPTTRLYQLANHFHSKFIFRNDPMQHVFVEKVFDKESLLYVVKEKLAKLPNIRLVIIDSIADVFRGSFTDSLTLHELSTYLRHYSRQMNALIIVSNQASYNPVLRQNVPYLGSCWTGIVDTRIHFLNSPRKMRIDFSPVLPQTEIPFVLLESGIRGI